MSFIMLRMCWRVLLWFKTSLSSNKYFFTYLKYSNILFWWDSFILIDFTISITLLTARLTHFTPMFPFYTPRFRGGGGGGGYRKGTLAWNALTSHYHWHMIEIGLYQEDPKLLLAATFWVRDVKSMTNTGKYLRSHWHPLIFEPHIASKKMKVVKIVKKLVYWKFCGSVQNDLFYMMNSFLMTCQNRLPQNHFIATDFSVIYSKRWKNHSVETIPYNITYIAPHTLLDPLIVLKSVVI